jgi:hypothetical protein
VAGLLGVSGTVSPAWGGTEVGNGMLVGLTRGQTARLQVLYPPDPMHSCPVELRFFDSLGTLLAEALETVRPGHVVFLDLNGDEVLRDRLEDRLQIYGRVDIQRADRRACRGRIVALEIFDNVTFKTMVVIAPPDPM